MPAAKEEMEAAFAHHGVDDFPMVTDHDSSVRVMMGSLYGRRSPVKTTSETIFGDVMLKAGRTLPLDPSVTSGRVGAKAGFDLTWPFGTANRLEPRVPEPPHMITG